MMKIINGKLYNTETAECVGSYYYGNGDRDFYHVEEELYRKKNGEFFLAGEGGAMTEYSEPAFGGGRQGGERITPFTEAEARLWAEEHLSAAEYLKYFDAEE